VRRDLVALLLVLSSCAPSGPLDVGYHGDDAGYVAALEAANAWNQTCGADLVNVHRGDGEIDLREQEGITHNAYGETTFERPILNAVGPREPVAIWFMSGWHALPVLTHEFGHALGLGHADSGIMDPHVASGFDALDPATGNTTLAPGMITAETCKQVTR